MTTRRDPRSIPALLLALGVALGASIAGCGRPLLLIHGGALEGPVAPTPESWSFTDDIKTVQLETRPEDPYSVNIWIVALDGFLYAHAGAKRTTWVENIEADPNVRLAVDGEIYELVATRVVSQEEFDRFSDAYDRKYGHRPRNGNVDEAYLFRLAAR